MIQPTVIYLKPRAAIAAVISEQSWQERWGVGANLTFCPNCVIRNFRRCTQDQTNCFSFRGCCPGGETETRCFLAAAAAQSESFPSRMVKLTRCWTNVLVLCWRANSVPADSHCSGLTRRYTTSQHLGRLVGLFSGWEGSTRPVASAIRVDSATGNRWSNDSRPIRSSGSGCVGF